MTSRSALSVLAGLLTIGLWSTSGCSKSGENSLEKKKQERAAKAAAAGKAVLGQWAAAMLESFPAEKPEGKLPRGAENPFGLVKDWREAVALGGYAKKLSDAASNLEVGEAKTSLLIGMRVFEATHDYWAGKVMRGLQAQDELGDKVAADSARVIVEWSEHLDALTDLNARDDIGMWKEVVAFEFALGPVVDAYAQAAHSRNDGGYARIRDRLELGEMGSLCQAVMTDGKARSGVDAELCRKTLGEHRHLLLSRAYAGFAKAKLQAFAKEYPESYVKDLVTRMASDLDQIIAEAEPPPEAPVLPDTLASGYFGGDTWVVDAKGIHNDDGETLLSRSTFEPLDQRGQTVLHGLFLQMADAEDRTRVGSLATEKSTILDVVARIGAELSALGDRSLGLGGRRRHDDSNRRAAFEVSLAPLPVTPIKLVVGEEQAQCTPLGTIGRRVTRDRVDTVVRLDAKSVRIMNKAALALAPPPAEGEDKKQPTDPGKGDTPPTAEAAPPTAEVLGTLPLTADRQAAAALRNGVLEKGLPVLLAADQTTSMQTLHRVLSSLLVACEDKECATTEVPVSVLIATCR